MITFFIIRVCWINRKAIFIKEFRLISNTKNPKKCLNISHNYCIFSHQLIYSTKVLEAKKLIACSPLSINYFSSKLYFELLMATRTSRSPWYGSLPWDMDILSRIKTLLVDKISSVLRYHMYDIFLRTQWDPLASHFIEIFSIEL